MKQQLITQLGRSLDTSRYSVPRLLNIYFAESVVREKLLTEIEIVTREYLSQDITISYSPDTELLGLVESLITKLRKEKGLHFVVAQKEHRTLQQHDTQLRTADQEISYLKELLKEEQLEVDNWKQEAARLEQHITALSDQLRLSLQQQTQMGRLSNQHL